MKHIKLSLILAPLMMASLSAERLKEIIVSTPTNSEQKLSSTTSVTEVITANDIKERGYTTITEVLQSIVGISYTQNGGLGSPSSLYIRGMDSKSALVMIDGIRYNDITGLNGASYENITVDNIERIEIVKGAQSGIWGADASAGVINIITKGTKSGLHGGLSIEAGSFKGRKYSAHLSYANQMGYASVRSSWLKSDGFSAMMSADDNLDKLEDDGYKNQTTDIKAGIKIGQNSKIDASYMDIEADADGDGYDPVTYAPDPNSIYNSKSHTQLARINYNYTDEKNSLNIYAQNSKFRREYPQGYVSLFKGQTREYGANYKRNYRDSDSIMIGIQRDKFSQDDSIEKKYINSAIYVTNHNEFVNSLGKSIVTESLRYDKFDAFDNKTTGKIGFKQIIERFDGLSVSANYGTAYTVPTLYQLYSPYGSADLSPQSSKSVDLSIAYQGLKATYFKNTITDMIGWDYSVAPYGGYGNLAGTSRIDGIEFSYATSLGSDFYLRANYTHLIKAEDNQGKALGRRAKNSANVGLDYYGVEKLHVGVQLKYTGERFDRGDKQGAQTGKYTTIDVSADYQLTDNVNIYAKVENLTDKKYQTVDGYATSPRAFFAGVRAKF